jgi:hypothetical protein
MDEPILSDPYTKQTITIMVDIITFVYIGEALLKVIAMGFCFGKHSYLSDSFNKFDFAIVVLSIVTFSIEHGSADAEGVNLGWAKAFRALRALRPLKLVSKNEGMKVVVNSLLNSLPNLMNVMMIMLLFYAVFAILAVQLLSGKCGYCSVDPYLEGNDKEFCEATDGVWITPPNNFNHFGYAMQTWFEVSTLEMWPDIMFRAIDSSTEQDGWPVRDNKFGLSGLFVVFIFMTTFFAMNLFLSEVINKFQEETMKN